MEPKICADCGGSGEDRCPNPGHPNADCLDCVNGAVECGNCGGSGFEPGRL